MCTYTHVKLYVTRRLLIFIQLVILGDVLYIRLVFLLRTACHSYVLHGVIDLYLNVYLLQSWLEQYQWWRGNSCCWWYEVLYQSADIRVSYTYIIIVWPNTYCTYCILIHKYSKFWIPAGSWVFFRIFSMTWHWCGLVVFPSFRLLNLMNIHVYCFLVCIYQNVSVFLQI